MRALDRELGNVYRGRRGRGPSPEDCCPPARFEHVYNAREEKSFLPIVAALRAQFPGRSKRPVVLQLASGFGQLGGLLEREGMEPAMVDVSRENIEWGRRHGTAGGLAADARELPIRDGSVDAVVSDHFLCASHYVLTRTDEEEILDEVRRVLRPGGILVLYNHHRKAPTFGLEEPSLAMDFKVLCHRRRAREEKMTVLQLRD
jgi:ubiquinone/menaquinone biosynthesis C-methylase UbiE